MYTSWSVFRSKTCRKATFLVEISEFRAANEYIFLTYAISGHVGDFGLQAMKGLADTAAAAGEPMPALDRPLAWDEIERWITNTVETSGRELLPTP